MVWARGSDRPFNPASVVKVGTTLWALDRLGVDHRYVTSVGYRGSWRRAGSTIEGSLMVVGGADPDFQPENAFLVARELNRLGVREVSGGLLVQGEFWMGWEGGVQRRLDDPRRRTLEMGRRFQQALDPRRWDKDLSGQWRRFAERTALDPAHPPAVRVRGRVAEVETARMVPLLRHLSNPLPVILKRFDSYSNNDIQRVADGLGGTAAEEAWLRTILGVGPDELSLSTSSGELVNRMTPRVVVRLLRTFRATVRRLGLEPADLLPSSGCDPGTVRHLFPSLRRASLAGAVTAKTGTLTTTDGGVAVLAGFVRMRTGHDAVFCVAAPNARGHIYRLRREEQTWLLHVIRDLGGAEPGPCGAPFQMSDADADVVGLAPLGHAGSPAAAKTSRFDPAPGIDPSTVSATAPTTLQR